MSASFHVSILVAKLRMESGIKPTASWAPNQLEGTVHLSERLQAVARRPPQRWRSVGLSQSTIFSKTAQTPRRIRRWALTKRIRVLSAPEWARPPL